MKAFLRLLCGLVAAGCVSTLPHAPLQEPSGAPRPERLTWANLDASAFARARVERRLIVIDGSAEWCHWCHVMESTTYHDPRVRHLLELRFVAVKVDIDSRPDFEERYHEWGWPATILMTAEGMEIEKYRGYLSPEQFLAVLNSAFEKAAVSSGSRAEDRSPRGVAPDRPLGDAMEQAQQQLESYWDPVQGSWGRQQKAPLHWDNAWALRRAKQGDTTARERILFTLEQEARIVDPVWGGICQYSTDGDWNHPHYEKLAVYQAGAIEDFANAYALSGEKKWLERSQLVRGFVDHFLTSPEGAYYTTMDADLNAHDPKLPFVSGHDYYARSDASRRALGIPRIDVHEYGRENGLMIAAYVALFEASGDESALAAARRAADRVLATHASGGGITHAPRSDESPSVMYLADNASFAYSLTRLYEATGDKARYLDSAKEIADTMLHDLFDVARGGFFANTPDASLVGTLSERSKPFEENVLAVRFLGQLARLVPTDAYRDSIARTLALVGANESIRARGRMVGDLLLAIDETVRVR